MFERIFAKVLSRFLSKYFKFRNERELTNLINVGVWSGYISLENLVLKDEVLDEMLFGQKGLPFKLVSCGIRRVEITVPWAKLTAKKDGSSTTATSASTSKGGGSSSDDNSGW